MCNTTIFLSIREASEIFNINEKFIRNLCKEENNFTIKIGKKYFLHRDRLEEFILSNFLLFQG